jgi:hypothetical protein
MHRFPARRTARKVFGHVYMVVYSPGQRQAACLAIARMTHHGLPGLVAADMRQEVRRECGCSGK